MLISLLVLAGYAYNISAYAAILGSDIKTLQKLRDEDRSDMKEDLKYIRGRVDEISKEIKVK